MRCGSVDGDDGGFISRWKGESRMGEREEVVVSPFLSFDSRPRRCLESSCGVQTCQMSHEVDRM